MTSTVAERSSQALLQRTVAHPSLDAAHDAWQQLTIRHGDAAGVVSWMRSCSSQRLMPLLGERAEALDLGGEATTACELAALEAWGLNERLLATVRPSIVALRDAGVDVVALKGLGLLGDVYPQHRLRPIGDADLLIRDEQMAVAVDVLGRTGWMIPRHLVRMIRLGDTIVNLGLHHSAAAGSAGGSPGNGSSIDLHAVPVRTIPRGSIVSDFWDHAEEVPTGHPLADTGLRRLGAADHAFVIAAHTARPSNAGMSHPLVDLHQLMVARPELITETTAQRWATVARRYRLSLRTADVFDTAAELLGTPLPATVDRLRATTPRAAAMERRTIEAEHRLTVRSDALSAPLRRALDYSTVVTGGRGGLPQAQALGAVVVRWTVIRSRRR